MDKGLRQILEELRKGTRVEDCYLAEIISNLLKTYDEQYILDNWDTLVSIPSLDEYKKSAITKLRTITNDYINEFIPEYRQINFTSAKVNALFIFIYSKDENVKENVKQILIRIRNIERWITEIIGRFYELVNQILSAQDIETIETVINKARSIYESVPKPEKLESRDIAYIQQVWLRLEI